MEFARELIDAGADVNNANKRGVTPLLVAAGAGRTEIVRMLIAAGANVHARDTLNADTTHSVIIFNRDPLRWPAGGQTPLTLAAHGGHVSLVAIEDETAYLKFGGGCQGCGMVNVTLKQGVEKIVFEEVPLIKKIMDVTDHAAGTNPYYEPAK